MKVTLQRAIAGAIPLALLTGSALVAGAATGRAVVAAAMQIRPLAHSPYSLRPAATTPIVLGGGATLPIPAYLGLIESSGTTNTGLSGSVFGYFATQTNGLNVEYCATGSGKGKGVFDGAAGTVNINCSNAASGSTYTTFGFYPAPGQPTPSPAESYPPLTGTDAPLAQTDYNAYFAVTGGVSNHPTSPHIWEPVELPTLVGAIALAYHDNNQTSQITLSEAQICGVFSGKYSTFGKLLGNSDTTPLTVVFRADGSGTSFNFSNHLATVCPGQGVPNVYGANQIFPSADNALPAGSIGETGNSGVITEINATNGTIGYVEAGYLSTLNATGTGRAKVTNLSSKTAYDPVAGLPLAATTITTTDLQANAVVNQTTSSPGVAGGPSTTSLLTANTPIRGVPYGTCVQVIKPSTYANPAKGYPVIAVTYLLFNSYGNGTRNQTALRQLITDFTTPSIFKGGSSQHITTVDTATAATGTTGYSSFPSGFTTLQGVAAKCINA